MSLYSLRVLYVGLTDAAGRELRYPGYARGEAAGPEVMQEWDERTARMHIAIAFPGTIRFVPAPKVIEVYGFLISTLPVMGQILYRAPINTPKRLKPQEPASFAPGNLRILLRDMEPAPS